MSLFPWLLRQLLQRAKFLTHTEMQLETQGHYFTFLFIHLFAMASISSALIPTTVEVLNKDIAELPRILALNLPLAGNYYLSYLMIQAILLLASTICRLPALLGEFWKSRSSRTPRERLDAQRSLLFQIRWGEIYAFYGVLASIGKLRPFLAHIVLTMTP